MKLLSLFSFDKKFIKNLLILSLPLIGQNLITSSLNFLDNIMIGKEIFMKLLSLFSFDKKFIKNLLILSLPLIGQNLITSSLNFLDNIMIGHLGETSIAAVGLANQYYLMFFLTTSAVCVGGSVLISQFWGKKEIFNIKKFAGIGLILSLLSSVFFTSIALFFPEFIIGLFDTNKDVMSTGSAYLRAVAPSYIFTCLSFNFCATLRSTGQTSIPMKGSLIGFLFNGYLMVSLTIFLFLENLELSHLELLELPLVQLLQDL